MNKIVFPVIVLTLSLGIASNLISCQDSANPTKKEEAEAEKIKTEQIKKSISEMGARYNAFTDWEKSSAQKTWEQVYTIDLEAVLVRSDSHPILFIAPVVDVEKRDNKYFVHFLYSSPLYLDIRFVLECDSEQVKKIMNQERTMRDVDTSWYAVVASITSLRKAMFEVKAEPLSSEEADIVVKPSNIFIATGHCQDLLFVGDYGLSEELRILKK